MSKLSADVPAGSPSARRSIGAYTSILELAVPVGGYLVLAALLALRHADRLNPDGVCYLRLGEYFAAGDWRNGFSLYWSPLFPLVIAGFSKLGVDGLEAAHLVLAIGGAALICATFFLLRLTTRTTMGVRILLLVAAVPAIAEFQLFVVAPDVLLSVILITALAMTWYAAAREKRGAFVLAGALFGLGYWAKAYALPFGLVAIAVSIWWLRRRASRSWRAPLGLALGGFALTAAPLVILLSSLNGGFTIGKSGPINHAVVGPNDILRTHPVVFGVPTPPHVTIWETPDQLPYAYWSPFASRSYFDHQVAIAARNSIEASKTLAGLDVAGLGLGSLIVGLILVGIRREANRDAVTATVWLAGLLGLYLGGYLLVAFEPRYVQSFALPVLLCTAALLASRLVIRPPMAWLVAAAVAASLSAAWIPRVNDHLRSRASPYLREVARELRAMGFQGPFAATSWYHGVALAYFSGQPHVGFPPDADPAVDATRLREAGVDWLVVFDLATYPAMPVQDLYPPTIPRALEILANEGWTMRREFVVSMNGQESHIVAFQRPAPSR